MAIDDWHDNQIGLMNILLMNIDIDGIRRLLEHLRGSEKRSSRDECSTSDQPIILGLQILYQIIYHLEQKIKNCDDQTTHTPCLAQR